MDFDSYHSDRHRNGHFGDTYKPRQYSGMLNKSQSLHSLPTRQNRHGFSYLSSATSPQIQNDRPSSRMSEQVTSSYDERPPSHQSDYLSRYSDRVSSHYSDRGSSRMSDFSPPPQRKSYFTQSDRRGSSMSRESMPSSYERTTNSLYDAPSIHDRGPAYRDSSWSGSGFSSASRHREEFPRNGYESWKPHQDEEEEEGSLDKRYYNMSSGYDNGSLDHRYDQSSSETQNGSSKYGSHGNKFHTISGSRHDYNGPAKADIFSDGFGYGYNAAGSETSRNLKDYTGSKSYSTFPRSYQTTDGDLFKSSSRSSYSGSRDGRSSPTVNGGSNHYTSDTGVHSAEDGEKHTGWFRNHQYGPLLTKEADLDDLREDVSRLMLQTEGTRLKNEGNYSMSSKSSHQLDSRGYQDYSTERESRTRRRDELQSPKARAVSQDRDLGYFSMRKEQPFNPPVKFHRSLSEGRQYHSMTNLDSTMKQRSTRSHTRRHHRQHRGRSSSGVVGNLTWLWRY